MAYCNMDYENWGYCEECGGINDAKKEFHLILSNPLNFQLSAPSTRSKNGPKNGPAIGTKNKTPSRDVNWMDFGPKKVSTNVSKLVQMVKIQKDENMCIFFGKSKMDGSLFSTLKMPTNL